MWGEGRGERGERREVWDEGVNILCPLIFPRGVEDSLTTGPDTD